MSPMASHRIKVLVVEDNAQVAEALQVTVERESDLAWIGWIPSADRLAAMLVDHRPDVAVVDLDMPGLDPFACIRAMTEAGCVTRFIIFTGNAGLGAIEQALGSGVWGYVCKSDGAEALLEALRRVARGEFALSPEARRVYQHR